MQTKSNQHNPEHWQVVAEREVFTYKPWMRISMQDITLPDGRLVENFGRIQLPDYISVFAQTADGHVIVERQYKHGVGFVSMNLPAGMIEPGEDPIKAAQRELKEETGYVSDQWTSLGSFVGNGNYGCGKGYFFLAQNAVKVTDPDSGDLEDMEILLFTVEELLEALSSQKIATIGAVASISLGCMALIGIINPSSED
jgi:ADP-ribose pyrophosphatase